MALTVVFFVKPPKFPDWRDMINGKLAAKPPDSTVPAKRVHFCFSGTYRTMAVPATEMKRLKAMKYVLEFRK